jgi:dihydrodipicolinate synthase/N-acetylneuraminate lyase
MVGVSAPPYAGVFPVVPTTFDQSGDLDEASQLRAIDFLIDAGVDGVCILANYSEQFALTDAERERLVGLILDHVAGRVPVIVTTSHYSTRIAADRSRRAEQAGASMVMLMPPYHGATIRPSENGIRAFFETVASTIGIPIMIQDAPVSGVHLSAPFLARLANEIDGVQYVKVEVPFAAAKLRELTALAGANLPGPFDGEEAITLMADLDAGATGTMPSALQPDLLLPIVHGYRAGQKDRAADLYARSLPLLNYENRQCGLVATKVLMKEGGIIACDLVRPPSAPLHSTTRAVLLEIARRLDPLILRWAS